MTVEAPAQSPDHALWQQGWYRCAAHFSSPNCDLRPSQTAIDLVVLHAISLPPGEYGGNQVQQLFGNQLDCQAHPYFERLQGLRLSAHFYIRRGGELWQFVSCDQRAWHAGVSSWRQRSRCNDNSIGIELEGTVGACFTSAQYASLSALLAAIMQQYPIQSLAGHEHIAPGRKDDPGAGFDWHQLQQTLALDASFLP